jgi:hypothetical protein
MADAQSPRELRLSRAERVAVSVVEPYRETLEIACAAVGDGGASHVTEAPFRPEKRVEERPAFAEHEEDPADGVHVDRVRPVRVHGEREDEPGGGDDLRDSDPHGRVVPAARSSILASRPAMSVAAASGARHRYGNVTIRPHACAKCATEPFAPSHGRCQAPLPKREFFDVARRAVRSHRRRRVSVRGSCPRRRSRGTRRRPRCLPR